jgi:hypothetical protein
MLRSWRKTVGLQRIFGVIIFGSIIWKPYAQNSNNHLEMWMSPKLLHLLFNLTYLLSIECTVSFFFFIFSFVSVSFLKDLKLKLDQNDKFFDNFIFFLYLWRLNFWFTIWTPPVVGKETDPKALEEYWDACCKLTLERFADLVFEELQTKDPQNVLFLIHLTKDFVLILLFFRFCSKVL